MRGGRGGVTACGGAFVDLGIDPLGLGVVLPAHLANGGASAGIPIRMQ